jgi:Ca2+-binding EF-hand superfamily protein
LHQFSPADSNDRQSANTINDLLKDYDENGDGKISQSEFQDILRSFLEQSNNRS